MSDWHRIKHDVERKSAWSWFAPPLRRPPAARVLAAGGSSAAREQACAAYYASQILTVLIQGYSIFRA